MHRWLSFLPALVQPFPHPDPAKLTVAVVLGNDLTEITDFLTPYDLFSVTGDFNVYAVAPTHHITTLTGGLDVVPDFSLAEYDVQVGRAPDVIVIPAIPTIQNAENAPLLTWIRQNASPHTIVLSWCVGAETLALTGLLDSKSATTHWADIDRLERSYPKVHWQRGVRYVDNGSIVTAAGVTSGIDATLHVLERLKGRGAAQAVSAHFHYPSFSYVDSPRTEQYTMGASDSIYVLNGSYNWAKASYGVLLSNSIGEIELASIFDTYAGSLVAQTLTVAQTHQVITTEHGLHLIPRWSMADLPGVSRLLVPGANAVQQAGDSVAAWKKYSQAPIVYIHAGSVDRFAFNAPLEDLAGQSNVPTAIFATKRLEYRVPLQLNGSGWPLLLILLPLLFGLLGLALAWGIDRRLTACRNQRQKRAKSQLRVALAPTLAEEVVR